MRNILILFTALVIGFSLAAEEKKPKVAVMEIEDKSGRIDKEFLENAAEALRAELIATDKFIVISKDRQRKAMIKGAKKESWKECYDQSCRIELGQALTADNILSGIVTYFGKKYTLTIEMIDLAKEATVKGASADFDATEEVSIAKAVRETIAVVVGVSSKRINAVQSVDGGQGESKYASMVNKEKREKEKLDAAWAEVRDIAVDRNIPKGKRVAVLNEFLNDFPKNNDHEEKAEELIDILEDDDEPEAVWAQKEADEKRKGTYEYSLLEGTEWFAFRIEAGSHGGGGMLSFFTLRWNWFYWEIIRAAGAGGGPGLGGDNSVYGLGGTSFGVPIRFLGTLEHELRLGTGFYGGIIATDTNDDSYNEHLGLAIMSLEISYLWHFGKGYSLQGGLESYVSLYPDPEATAIMVFVGMRFR
ncbi:MAG TPA: hypothetical protein P5077_08015 [bacterium]|nr:hypothetical protein [bacterium]